MLTRIVLENYRSCYRTSFSCHPRLSVLIGPNSSGKTNVLQAIMFLNKMAQEDEHYRFHREMVNVTSSVRATFCDNKVTSRLSASVDAYTDESNTDNLVNARQKWFMTDAKGKKITFELPMYVGLMRKDVMLRPRFLHSMRIRAHLPFLHAEYPQWALDRIATLARFCSGMRYYSASQFTNPGACPVSFEIEKEGPHSRPSRLRGHSGTLYSIYRAQKGEGSDRYAQFIDVVGPHGLGLVDRIVFREIRTSSIEVTVRVGGKIEKRRRQKVLVVPQFRKGREILSPNQLSEGTFKTLALLFYIITDDSTALLIEEPEVCVHQGLLSSILELIRKYSEHKQMFISTHSDYVLDHVAPENVFTVKYNKDQGTEVRHVQKALTRREYAALRHYLEHDGNLGDYWREGGLE